MAKEKAYLFQNGRKDTYYASNGYLANSTGWAGKTTPLAGSFRENDKKKEFKLQFSIYIFFQLLSFFSIPQLLIIIF